MRHQITLSDGSVKVVHTYHDFPPIPVRDYDWSAYGDDYEPGYPVGRGPTEQMAISDYVMLLEDA
jgi:hypothetical protein